MPSFPRSPLTSTGQGTPSRSRGAPAASTVGTGTHTTLPPPPPPPPPPPLAGPPCGRVWVDIDIGQDRIDTDISTPSSETVSRSVSVRGRRTKKRRKKTIPFQAAFTGGVVRWGGAYNYCVACWSTARDAATLTASRLLSPFP